MVRAQTVVAVLATGALLGAGGAFAANKVIVKGGNVVDGSLTGKDLRDGSVQQRDLSASLRARLARVGVAANGAQGAQGPQGAPGPQGAQGPAGLSVAASSKSATPKDITAATEILAIDSATGGYTAAATVEVTGGASSSAIACTITVGTNTAQGSATIGNNVKLTIPVLAAGNLATPGKITLSCTPTGGTVTIAQATLVTTRIANLTTDGY